MERMLKGALHTHTTCSDGVLTPEELLREYWDLEFDFVALTDHDFLMKPGAYDNIPEEYDGVLVFKGIERTVFARGYFHINEIYGEHEVLRILNHPAQYGLAIEYILERLEEVKEQAPVDAVEITLKGFYTPEFDVPALPFPKVASDDAHTPEACGRAWVEVPCERDRDAILRAIKAGNARPCYTQSARFNAWNDQGGTLSG